MGDRVYTAAIDNVTISAIQDIFSIVSGTGKGAIIHHIRLDAFVTSEAAIRLVLKRTVSAPTQGTGGTVPGIKPVDPLDAAATVVVHANDVTTQMTGGTLDLMGGFQWDVALPFEHLPAPEDRERITISQGIALVCPAAPASTVISGYIKFAEVP